MKSIRLHINDDISVENIVDILKNAGIDTVCATEMKDCLELGLYDQEDLTQFVQAALADEEALKDCSEEEIEELSRHIAKKIPDDMSTSSIEDNLNDCIDWAITDYVSNLNLENELKEIRK